MRRNKTINQQQKFYQVDDFKFYLLEKWDIGYPQTMYSLYRELNLDERLNFIKFLINEKIHNEWEQIVVYLLSKNKNVNRKLL